MNKQLIVVKSNILFLQQGIELLRNISEKEQLKTPKKKKGIEPRLEHTKFFPHGKTQMKSYFKTVATMMELQV